MQKKIPKISEQFSLIDEAQNFCDRIRFYKEVKNSIKIDNVLLSIEKIKQNRTKIE